MLKNYVTLKTNKKIYGHYLIKWIWYQTIKLDEKA